MKEKTIKEYAKALGIPLSLILKDFERLGLPCNAEDIVNPDMRSRLLSNSFKDDEKSSQDIKAQTIAGYAKSKKISMGQALSDLRNSGFTCGLDDVLSLEMRKVLSDCLQKRRDDKLAEYIEAENLGVSRTLLEKEKYIIKKLKRL